MEASDSNEDEEDVAKKDGNLSHSDHSCLEVSGEDVDNVMIKTNSEYEQNDEDVDELEESRKMFRLSSMDESQQDFQRSVLQTLISGKLRRKIGFVRSISQVDEYGGMLDENNF